ncbi:hypothetical protein ACH5RR_008887 [Cinchona calisaya]|uniref:Uncharacterized protein n=1 Tax=Cinchona calisaya TaxID=153742 RepID=A0ABD3ACL0_9GENT
MYGITLHHLNKEFPLRNIDPDRYSYIDLLADVSEKALNHVSGGLNIMIVLSCDIPSSVGRMEVNNDNDVLEMFKLHRRSGCINVYVRELNANIEINMNHNAGNGNNISNVNFTREVRVETIQIGVVKLRLEQ